MVDTRDFRETVSILQRPDLFRRVAALPVVRPIARLFGGTAATAQSPVDLALTGRLFQRFEGEQKSQQVMAHLLQQGTGRQVFGKVDDADLLTEGLLAGQSLNDIRANPQHFADQLTHQQKAWIQAADDIEVAKLDFLRRNGIDINEITFEEGGRYAGRRVWARINPDGELMQTAFVAPGPSPIGAKAAFEKERVFRTQAEAIAEGFRYLPEEDALWLNVRAAYNRVADKQMTDWLLPRIAWREAVEKEVSIIPAFKGKILTGPDAARIEETIRKSMNPEFSRALDAISNVNAVGRYFNLAGDISVAGIQLIFLAGQNPKIYGKALLGFVQSFFDTTAHARYLASKRELIQRHPDLILSMGGTEFTEALSKGGILEQGPLKVMGRPLQPFQRGFQRALDIAGIEMARSLEHMAKNAADISELDSFVNEFRGLLSTKRLGVNPKMRQVETVVLLAPQYNRAIGALVVDALRGAAETPLGLMGRQTSLRGQLARDGLAKGMGAVAAMTVAIGIMRGEPIEQIADHLNPGSDNFLTWDVAEQRIGIGSKVRSLLKLWAESAENPEDLLRLSMANPALRFVRANLSYVPSSGIDLLTGRDYIGDPTRDGMLTVTRKVIVENLLPVWVNSVLWEGSDIQQRLFRGAMEFVGGRAYPRSLASRRNELREQLSQKVHGQAWGDLTWQKRERLEVDNPELEQLTTGAYEYWAGRADPKQVSLSRRRTQFWETRDDVYEKYESVINAIPQGETYRLRETKAQRDEEIKRLKSSLGLTDDDLYGFRPERDKGLSLLDVFRWLGDRAADLGGRPLDISPQDWTQRMAQSRQEWEQTLITSGQWGGMSNQEKEAAWINHAQALGFGTTPEMARSLVWQPGLLDAWLKGLPIPVVPGGAVLTGPGRRTVEMTKPGEEFSTQEQRLFRPLADTYYAIPDQLKDQNGLINWDLAVPMRKRFLAGLGGLQQRFEDYMEQSWNPTDMVRQVYEEWISEYYYQKKDKRDVWLVDHPSPQPSRVKAIVMDRWGYRFTEKEDEVDHPQKWLVTELDEAIDVLPVVTIDSYQRQRSRDRIAEVGGGGRFYATSGILVDQNNIGDYERAVNWLDANASRMEAWQQAEPLRNQRDYIKTLRYQAGLTRNAIIDNPQTTVEEKSKAYADEKVQREAFNSQLERIRAQIPTYPQWPDFVVRYFSSSPSPSPVTPAASTAPVAPQGLPVSQSETVSAIFATMPQKAEGATQDEVSTWWKANESRLHELGWRPDPKEKAISDVFDTMPDRDKGATSKEVNTWWETNRSRLIELGWTPRWETSLHDAAEAWWKERRQRGEPAADIQSLGRHLEGLGFGTSPQVLDYLRGPGAPRLERDFIWSEYYALRDAGRRQEAADYFKAKKSRLIELGWKPSETSATKAESSAQSASFWDTDTNKGPAEWRSEFEEVHGRSPSNLDYRDYLWSLGFLERTGRPPGRADWVKHYWQDVREGRPASRLPEFARRNGNRTMSNSQWQSLQKDVGRGLIGDLLTGQFEEPNLAPGTRSSLLRIYRDRPMGARSFGEWLNMAESAYRREVARR